MTEKLITTLVEPAKKVRVVDVLDVEVVVVVEVVVDEFVDVDVEVVDDDVVVFDVVVPCIEVVADVVVFVEVPVVFMDNRSASNNIVVVAFITAMDAFDAANVVDLSVVMLSSTPAAECMLVLHANNTNSMPHLPVRGAVTMHGS
jgi:hypothetical protein